MLNDLPRHVGQRNKLVKLLIGKGIRNKAVLKAIGKVPRHLFLDSSFENFAYQNQAFPIAAGQTISHPYTVAFQSELLQIKPGDTVLEVGTGSGYQAAVLCEMGVKVFSIERQKELFDHTRLIMRQLGYRLDMFFGDGYRGLPDRAPFDGIVVTAGAPFIPQALVDQLKPKARLIIPVGDDVQEMKVLEKTSSGEVTQQDQGEFRFVPLLEKRN
jgi:protein-L-isoaspartate(D-aspartate) O-methyltransferase